MAHSNYSPSEPLFQKWIKEGRGQGRGQDYRPWLTVRDVPSHGRSHRIFGFKSQRTHHLLSDLELAAFFILEWHPQTQDVREQFPLQREATLEIAQETGIKHPATSGVAHYMSTDFLVNTSAPDRPLFAIQAKRSEDLTNARTIEKLEIERRYWKQKDIPWFLLTERDIPTAVTRNIEWLYPSQTESVFSNDLAQQLEFYDHQLQENPTATLVDLSKSIDMAYDLELGQSLRELRQLLAMRFFSFDIRIEFRQLKGADLTLSSTIETLEAVHASDK